jgi:imidazolonepropionase-like amidohydrolase
VRTIAIAAGAAALLAVALAGALRDHANAQTPRPALLVGGARVFDGVRLVPGNAVLVRGGRVEAIGGWSALRARATRTRRVPGATILPGVVDLHVHIDPSYGVRSGVTTVRNLGEPLTSLPRRPDVPGRQRERSAGPIVSVPGGYPSVHWGDGFELDVGPQSAEQVVATLAGRHADVVKIALEPGPGSWPMLSAEQVRALVAAAHARGLRVTAHVQGRRGLELAIAGGVDELAHMPCEDPLAEELRGLAQRNVPIVATLRVQTARCRWRVTNTRAFTAAGGTVMYGSDYGVPGVPLGIDHGELRLLRQALPDNRAVLVAATSAAGARIGGGVGRLTPGGPADLFVVRGNPLRDLDALKDVALVLVGGAAPRI